MATITEDYVSFEIAKLLKEKGFQQLQDNCGYFTTEMVYSIDIDDDGKHHFAHQYPAGVYNKDKYIAAPTLQMAMKWLREVHKLFIGINIEVGDIQMLPSYDFEETVLGYNFVIYNEETLIWAFKDKTPRSYEKACEAAIKYCLENLI